jgi:hypothetical protein
METFIARYRPFVTAILSGFDRLVFRGTLLPLIMDGGMYTFLTKAGVRLLDFKHYVLATSERVKAASLHEALEHARPIHYLQSSSTDKEALARDALAKDPVDRGLICAMRVVEPCMSFEYHRAADRRERGLKRRPRKCLHIYKYYLPPVFGFLNARSRRGFPSTSRSASTGGRGLPASSSTGGGATSAVTTTASPVSAIPPSPSA